MSLEIIHRNIQMFPTSTLKWDDYLERIVPFILALIWALIIIMALTSGFNKHPDEKQHFDAAKYYRNHWLPPPVGAQETADSYSKYGSSYLDELDPVYLLAGKFSLFLSPLISKNYIAMRLFNVFLFFLLMLYCAAHAESHVIFVPLLITPQVWYIFSYFNGDAFPLFICIIMICELVSKQSFFRRAIEAIDLPQFIWGGIFMGLLMGLLCISKRNYYILILFILFIISWQIWQADSPDKRRFTLRYLFIIGFALIFFLCRYGYDVAINGYGKAGKMAAYAEKVAEPQFKPSIASYKRSFFGLHLKAKGLKYSELFSKWNWHKLSFASFFGVYDYMKIFSSERYYKIMFYIMSLFLIYVFSMIIVKGGNADRISMIVVLAFMSATIFISSYHSWINDFQAQGRYLFPILGMLGYLLYQNKRLLNKCLLYVFVMAICGLSAYSFIFTGLSHLMV